MIDKHKITMKDKFGAYAFYRGIACVLTMYFLSTAVFSEGYSQKATLLFERIDTKSSTYEKPDNPDIVRSAKLRINKRVTNAKSELPSNISFQPFLDVAVNLKLDKVETSSFKGLKIYRAKSDDPKWQHLDHYRDATIIYNPHTDKYVIQLSTSFGSFEVVPTDEDDVYQVSEWSPQGFTCRTEDHIHNAKSSKNQNAKSGCEEKDKDGIYVADLFIGYSYEASFHVQDYDAHALSLTEEVNNGLINSNVTNVRIRLVGTGISDNNPGVVTSVLGDIYTWFADEIAATAADYVAAVQVPTGAENEAGGWAGVGGYSSVNSIYSAAAVFRHELGHNIGSSHCTPGILPYAAGYNNGNVKTHMCGNNVNFYSTPLVNDDMGDPLGDAATADNARVWRERAALVSARRRHTIKYDEEDTGCQSNLVNGRYHIQNVNSNKYLATLSGSTARGNRLALADNQAASNEWDLIHIGESKYRIQMATNSNRRIDVPGGTSSAGADIIIWSNNGSVNQDFSISEIAPDIFTIKTPSAQCLQVEGAGNTEGDPIEQNSCDDSDNTKWRFLPVSGGSNLGLTVSSTDVTCFGGNTGFATVSATGGSGIYTYSWSTGGDGITENNLTAGNYTVIVNDGITDIPFNFVINQPAAITVSIASVPSSGNDGTITLMTSGGQSPYSYSWSNGASGNAVSGLAPGLYTATISDANSCAQVKEIYIPCSQLNKACDDNDSKTIGDLYDENCNCAGTPISCSEDNELINRAVGKPVSQITTDYGGVASRAVDGNTSGQYSDGSITHTEDSDTLPWWELDLLESVEISALAIWNRTDCCTGRLKDYYVLISDAPFNSADLSSSINQDGVWSQHIVEKANPTSIVQPNIIGRYVRIQKVDKGVLSLAEVEVFSCQLCTYYADTDNDGYGDPDSPFQSSCLAMPSGYVTNNTDCNDSDPEVTPLTVSECGDPLPVITIINPLASNDWEVKAKVVPNGNSISSISLEHGEGDFANSTPISITEISAIQNFNIDQVINIGSALTYQFRINVMSKGVEYLSNVYTIEPNQDYCIPTDENDLWYKRFNKVEFNGITYTDSGNADHGVYEDATAVDFGALDPGGTYTLNVTTSSSQWSNLTYYIYIDLNNDKDFTDYHELVGSSSPQGHTTPVSITIPTADIVMEQTLRMRIVGAETSNHNTCHTAIGNTKDFSIMLNNNCVEVTWYADTDGDGFGDLNNTRSDCQRPTDYVENSTDCNDADENEKPDQIWYIDADGDGYPTNGTITSCIRPLHGKLESELSGTDEDCDDSDAGVFQCQTTPIEEYEDSRFKITLSPNPSKDESSLNFEIQNPGYISINISSLSGSLVKRLSNQQFYSMGSHTVSINTSDLPSGIYLVTFRAPDALITRKLIVAK